MLLARMVNPAKWTVGSGFGATEIPADAFTSDMKTTGNTLSFWRCADGTRAALERAALALASSRNREDKLVLAWIDASAPEVAGVKFEQAPNTASTPIAALKPCHYDAVTLDYVRHGVLAEGLRVAIAESRVETWTKKQVTSFLADAVSRQELRVDDLESELRTAVEKELALRPAVKAR